MTRCLDLGKSKRDFFILSFQFVLEMPHSSWNILHLWLLTPDHLGQRQVAPLDHSLSGTPGPLVDQILPLKLC